MAMIRRVPAATLRHVAAIKQHLDRFILNYIINIMLGVYVSYYKVSFMFECGDYKLLKLLVIYITLCLETFDTIREKGYWPGCRGCCSVSKLYIKHVTMIT